MVRIAVLVSGGGTNLQALIDAQSRGELKNGRIAAVTRHAWMLPALTTQLTVPYRPLSTSGSSTACAACAAASTRAAAMSSGSIPRCAGS